MKYPKIHNLWKRDPKTKLLKVGEFSKLEFSYIKYWTVQEKYDGTNIRVMYNVISGGRVEFKGRSDKSTIPEPLMKYLEKTFTLDMMKKQFPDARKVILFGEGYGEKINNNRHKIKGVSFVLFDAWIDGWWLEADDVHNLGVELSIERIGWLGRVMDKENIIKHVETMEKRKDYGEGIVAKAHPQMLFRDGTPIMFKLKSKDYINLRKLKVESE